MNVAYHGTAFRHLKGILKNGIKPRKLTKRKSVWTDFPSHTHLTYLTVAYPLYFGYSACRKNEDKIVIFEVDLNQLHEWNLYPDEDFIAQVLCQQQGRELKEVHNEVRDSLSSYQHCWKMSVEGLGNLCHYGVIPPEAITRYVVLDYEERHEMTDATLAPCITIMNYRIKGQYYRDLVAWLFRDRETLPQYEEAMRFAESFRRLAEVDPDQKHLADQYKMTAEYWLNQSSEYEGIELHVPKKKKPKAKKK